MNTTCYCVAGHLFTLTLQPQWFGQLSRSFSPFVADLSTADNTACLFRLTQTDDLTAAMQQHDFQDQHTLGGEKEDLSLVYARDPSGGHHSFTLAFRSEPACCTALCSPDFSEAAFTLYGPEKYHTFAVNNLIMMLYAVSSASRGTLMFHSSVTMNQGKGYLFLGKSGTGKSTHSSLWLKHIPGSELLNDDNPIVRVGGPDGSAVVYGSPWSGKTPCYKRQQVPVGGIVKLTQAPFNRMQQLNPLLAYAAVAPTVSNMRWYRPVADDIHASLDALIQSVPVYSLQCLPDEAAARLSESTLKGGHA